MTDQSIIRLNGNTVETLNGARLQLRGQMTLEWPGLNSAQCSLKLEREETGLRLTVSFKDRVTQNEWKDVLTQSMPDGDLDEAVANVRGSLTILRRKYSNFQLPPSEQKSVQIQK